MWAPFEAVNDLVHDIIRGVSGWGHEEAQSVEDTEPQAMSAAKLQNMDRGILHASAIEHAPDYEKVGHSPSVKSLINHINAYNIELNNMRIPEEKGTDQEFMNSMAEVNGKVFAAMQQMQTYLIRKAQGYAKKGKRYAGVMGVCAAAATNIRTQMDWVNKIQENCFYALRKGLVVPYGQSYAQLLKETTIFQETDETDATLLGQGGVNSVYKVRDEERGTDRVLKEGHMDMEITNSSEKDVYERIKIQDTAIGKKHTMNTAHRDVAVSMIDKLFNLNAAVDTSLARSKSGNQASLMDLGAGKEVNKTFSYMDKTGEKRARILRQLWINMAYLQGYKLNETKLKEKEEAKKTRLTNINSAQFLESTYNLAALDIIVGHVDRHAGNMMMTESGVKAIDNDSAFSLRDAGQLLGKATKDMTSEEMHKFGTRSYMKRNEKGEMVESDMEIMNMMGRQAYLFFDKTFPYVTKEFRNKIVGVSSAAVRGTLKGLLEEDEIEACVGRVEALQKYLKGMSDDKIVGSFDDIDREAYSSEITNDAATNIMAQIRASGHEYGLRDFEGDGISTGFGLPIEAQALRSYVARECKIPTLAARPIAVEMINLMIKKDEEGDFNLEDAIASGELKKILNQAVKEVNLREGKKA